VVAYFTKQLFLYSGNFPFRREIQADVVVEIGIHFGSDGMGRHPDRSDQDC
jgi:hypothetical protein